MFNREILRSIRTSLGRFVAIAGIVALGCGFYAGLRMTAPDMNLSAEAYYDASQLMDIRVVSSLGMTDDDIQSLRAIEGVKSVDAAYETDVMTTVAGEQYVMRIHSLTQDSNHLELAEGDWPQGDDECVLSADKVMGTPVSVGGRIQIIEGSSDLDDVLKVREMTVTGFVHSPYYVSSVSMGVTTLGSGTIQQFMYVQPEAFADDYPYTEAFVTVDGADSEFAGSAEYQSLVDDVVLRIEEIAPACEQRRIDSIVAEAQQKVDDACAEYAAERADAESELADAKAALDDAASEIADNEERLRAAQREYDSGTRELAGQREQAQARFAEAEGQIADGRAQLEEGAAKLRESEAMLAQLKMIPFPTPDERAMIAALEHQISVARQELADSRERLEASEADLATGRQSAERQFAEAEAKLASAKVQIRDGNAQLEEGRAEYERGLAEYNDGRAEADSKFADAEREIEDAQAKVDELASDLEAEWLVMDRTKNPGVVSFESDAERVDNIAAVFPFIFFLVAALVALTTMTRMVDEERMLIGTFKALGYSRARITSKYIIYALVASGIGAAVGIVALSLILPPVIMEAYAIIYYVPHVTIMPIDLPIALLAASLGVGVTLVSTWFACAATLRESPANLMLPRAPKSGKRILLERITPLWSRLTFLWKVTFRNIFRYKKRFVMTVIGIAGCTALLLTGLGLQDSINDIIDKQFGATVNYNVVVTFDDEDVSDEGVARIEELMGGGAHVSEENIKPITPGGEELTATLISPEDPAAFQQLWKLRERVGGEEIVLGEDGVVINEKLAGELDAKPGDTITIAEQDDMGNATSSRYELVVTGVMENYIANYVFMGGDIYRDTFGREPTYTSIYGNIGEGAEVHQEFSDSAHGVEGVKTVAFNDETIDTYRTMLKSVNMIVVVLVVAAAALAFIVLYNLTNINITERAREIATLKVLGFTRREIYNYIFRETLLLTMVGALAGLFLGIFLEGFVVVTAEVDYVMFGREIHPASFAWAFLLTIVFALVVMVFMRRKLDGIDMVESLKSNE